MEPLVNTLRRLILLALQDFSASPEDDKCALATNGSGDAADGAAGARMQQAPPIYICASHRTERIEDLFFTAARPWFACSEVT